MNYNRNELDSMRISRVKKLAIAKASQEGQKTSWIQSTPKDELINYLIRDEKPSTTKSVPTPPSTPPSTTPSTPPITPQQPPVQSGGLEDTIASLVLDKIKPTISNDIEAEIGNTGDHLIQTFTEKTDELQKKVDSKISSLQRPIKVYIDKVETKDVSGMKHKQFSFVLECLKHFKRVWLCGPSGTGKSHLIEQCASALGFDKTVGTYEYLKGSAGVSEGHMTGRMTFDGSFIDGSVSRSFREGHFLCLDEFDGFDANAGLVFNSIFDNQGILSTPNDKNNPFVLKHDNFHVAVASNTWGDGNDFDFAGRGQLDLATLDRLQAVKVFIDYDKNIERALVGDFTELADRLWDLRKRVSQNNLRRSVSTRLFIDGQKWRLAGKSIAQIMNIITTGWTKEEKDKIDFKSLI